jgi:hypothetical protein
MKKALFLPLFLSGCVAVWTNRSFDLSYNQVWSCQDSFGGARVKAYFYGDPNEREPVLLIATSDGDVEVQLDFDGQATNGGAIWIADTFVEGLNCNDSGMYGEFNRTK